MKRMTNGRGQQYRRIVVALCLVLSLGTGCGRQRSGSTGSVNDQAPPFYADSQVFEDNAAYPAVPPEAKPVNAAPFHPVSPAVLPAGTLLTVQLSNLLSANKVRPGDAFSASVAAPFTIGGKTLVERGTPVTGRVESVRMDDTNESAPRGYFRLTLNSITIGGRVVAIRTLRLYSRATVQPSKVSSQPATVRIQKGRRLTFRLTAPVTIDNSTPVMGQLLVGSAPAPARPVE